MADTNVTVRLNFGGAAKITAQFEAIGEAAKRATLAWVAAGWPSDDLDARRVEKARRRSRAARPPRTRHGRQHRTRA